MKFNVNEVPKERLERTVKVGNVYRSKGGSGNTHAWVVAAIRGSSLHLLGINMDGEIVTTQSYAMHTLEDRERIGFCPDITNLTLNVEPL